MILIYSKSRIIIYNLNRGIRINRIMIHPKCNTIMIIVETMVGTSRSN